MTASHRELGCRAQRVGLPRTLSTAHCSCRWLSTGVDCLDDLNSWGCENPHMSSHQLTVIRSSAACRMAHEEIESGAFLHVMRGCYVRVDDTRLLDTPWRTWITVARARLLAIHALGSGDRVFVGASSLASRGRLQQRSRASHRPADGHHRCLSTSVTGERSQGHRTTHG